MEYCVYILFSVKLYRFYIGTTDNVEQRMEEHNNQLHENAFTSKGIPWEIFLVIDKLSSKQAYAIEKHIKSMKSKQYIRNLHQYPEIIDKLKNNF
jgi:putative endonuclease